MKSIAFILLTLTLICLNPAWAGDKKSEPVHTTVFQTDIRCENCSIKIMNNVPALGKGIKDVVVNLDNKTVAVTYDNRKTDDQKIIKGFRSIRVHAEVMTPECDVDSVSCRSSKDE